MIHIFAQVGKDMSTRLIYGLSGLLATTGTAIIINLLSAAVQQRAFANVFTVQTMWILAGIAVLGSLIGYWLGEKLKVPSETQVSSVPTSPSTISAEKPAADTITMTRLRALLSFAKLKGKGIHLSDIILIGSRIDIES
jgi:hypothetical protein